MVVGVMTIKLGQINLLVVPLVQILHKRKLVCFIFAAV
jgi:Na+/glutamate symporter